MNNDGIAVLEPETAGAHDDLASIQARGHDDEVALALAQTDKPPLDERCLRCRRSRMGTAASTLRHPRARRRPWRMPRRPAKRARMVFLAMIARRFPTAARARFALA